MPLAGPARGAKADASGSRTCPGGGGFWLAGAAKLRLVCQQGYGPGMRLTLLFVFVLFFGCVSDDDSGSDSGTPVGSGRDTGSGGDPSRGSAADADGSACPESEPCSESEPCFPPTASCGCPGGAVREINNCMAGCCSNLDLEALCDLACGN